MKFRMRQKFWTLGQDKPGSIEYTFQYAMKVLHQKYQAQYNQPLEKHMKFGSAYYVAAQAIEILIFLDEAASELPDGAALIVETKDAQELLSAVEPYFILGSGS